MAMRNARHVPAGMCGGSPKFQGDFEIGVTGNHSVPSSGVPSRMDRTADQTPRREQETEGRGRAPAQTAMANHAPTKKAGQRRCSRDASTRAAKENRSP
jgi:hypothetical protein